MCLCKTVVKEKEVNKRGSMDARQEKNNGWVECVYVCVCRGGWVNEIFLITGLKVADCWLTA